MLNILLLTLYLCSYFIYLSELLESMTVQKSLNAANSINPYTVRTEYTLFPLHIGPKYVAV